MADKISEREIKETEIISKGVIKTINLEDVKHLDFPHSIWINTFKQYNFNDISSQSSFIEKLGKIILKRIYNEGKLRKHLMKKIRGVNVLHYNNVSDFVSGLYKQKTGVKDGVSFFDIGNFTLEKCKVMHNDFFTAMSNYDLQTENLWHIVVSIGNGIDVNQIVIIKHPIDNLKTKKSRKTKE